MTNEERRLLDIVTETPMDRTLTQNEQRLMELVIRADFSECSLGELAVARDAVLRERLPEGYERSLRDLVERSHDAQRAVTELAAKHPLGFEIVADIRKELRSKA